ncbi:MAG: hypothetical protein RLZZ337_1456 [Bacteroidota bacterium]|jgi:hypothetical protein
MKNKELALPKWVPKPLRKSMLRALMKQTILDYYNSLPPKQISEAEHEALTFVRRNGPEVFPYNFSKKYNKEDVEVHLDKSNGLKYVVENGRKLYFKRKSSIRGVKRNYNALRIEQDKKSAHRYLTPSFDIERGDILVDVGAAEGNLALSVIDKVKRVYLFETDPNWLEALEATFAPWKEKVVIVNKYVSDQNNAHHVSLDEYFKDKETFTFLKIDAEGAENAIIKGANTLLSKRNPMRFALCTYHKPNDAEEFEIILKNFHFKTEFSDGYMIFPELRTFYPPYLRNGLIRAIRN